MKKNILRVLITSAMFLMLSTIYVSSAETNENVCNITIQEDQGIPYVSARILDENTCHINLVYPNTERGCNYTVAVLTERAKPSNSNIVYLDQKMAQGNSVSFDIYPQNISAGQYYIFISSDAGTGIIEKTEVASFSYDSPTSDEKEASSIIVKSRPAKTVYNIGEKLDLRGLVITMIYNDNSTEEIAYNGDNISFSGFDSSKVVSQQRVTVIYQSMRSTFTVDIIKPGSETKPTKKISLKKAGISGIKSSYPYRKRAIRPTPIVRIGTTTLKNGKDYDILYENNKNAGTAFMIITGKGNYKDVIIKKFKIKPIASKISASKTAFKASALKKKTQKFKIKISGGSGKVAYKYPKKHISISKKGIVTLRKRMPKGIYKIKVTVLPKKNYKKTTKTIKISVK